MTVSIIKEEEAPVEGQPHVDVAPAAPPPTDDGDVQQLLAEWDARERPSELPSEPSTLGQTSQAPDPAQDTAVEDFLASLNGNDQRVTQLQGEIDSLKAAQHRRSEQEALGQYADALQKEVVGYAPHVEPDWAQTQLMAVALQNPDVVAAFDLRHTNKAWANTELTLVENELAQLQRTPGADPARIQQLTNYGMRLGLALNSQTILRNVGRHILKKAKALKPPVDPDLTADHFAVVAAVREGRGQIDFREPPPKLGNMTENEFRQYTKQFGF
jgi:hypothetical protein